MSNRALQRMALFGILVWALAPGTSAAARAGSLKEVALSSSVAARAAAVSGPVISVTPLAHDFGIVNVGTTSTFDFTFTDTGDDLLHVTGATITDPSFTTNIATADITIGPGGMFTFQATYAPTMGVNSSAVLTIHSNAANGDFSVNLSGEGNMPPVLDPIGNKTANAFVNLSFTTTASDPNDQIDDVLSFSVSPALPPGATYDSNTGAFSWTPDPSQAGTYAETFTVSDGHATASETITITVLANNHPPVANAGGPYSGGTGLPIQFDGSASSDPDGNNLTYAWNFGDGSTGTGVSPTHTYSFAGNYIASLTVTDDGTPPLSATAQASVSVLNTIPARVEAKLYGGVYRITGGGTEPMGMEITQRPPTDIDPATIRLSTTFAGAGAVTVLAADPKTASIGDIDNNGVFDMDVTFPRTSLATLLGNVPNGTTITLVMSARTTAATGAIPIFGTLQVKIKNGGGHAVATFASPNPFNPETAVTYELKNPGPVTVRVYSLEGRLVKTLVSEYATAGSHEVRWNGTDDNGRAMPSGVYFVKTESGSDNSVVKLSLVK